MYRMCKASYRDTGCNDQRQAKELHCCSSSTELTEKNETVAVHQLGSLKINELDGPFWVDCCDKLEASDGNGHYYVF